MTDDEKYEIATLTSEVAAKRDLWMAASIMNTPTDPVEREKSMINYEIVCAELWEAQAALSRAQARIANKSET